MEDTPGVQKYCKNNVECFKEFNQQYIDEIVSEHKRLEMFLEEKQYAERHFRLEFWRVKVEKECSKHDKLKEQKCLLKAYVPKAVEVNNFLDMISNHE